MGGEISQAGLAAEVRDLWVSLEGRQILKGIHFTLERGKFLGIVGPNGGGKTTLLRTLLGFIAPSRGSVRLLGLPPREALRSGWKVGYLPQGSHPDPSFPASALDVVLMGRFGRLGFLRYPGEEDREAARQALALVGMEGDADRHFGSLSGGQQQRISIARTLAGQPEILVLDEPSTSIDMVAQEDFYGLLKDLQGRLGIGIVMASHDVGVISTMVDDIACLNCTLSYHGRAREFGEVLPLEGAYGGRMGMLIHGEQCRDGKPGGDG